MHNRLFSPFPTEVRCILSREGLIIFFPRRLASNCAYEYTRYKSAFDSLRFPPPEIPSAMRIERQQKTVPGSNIAV